MQVCARNLASREQFHDFYFLSQDKLEEWKRQVVILDKEHTKEYKRCRNELKKRSSDTLRLQKKAKKNTSDNLQNLMDSSFASVNLQKAELDEVERKSLRMAMIEDRTRFCQFVHMLEPVVKQEYEMMYELGHLQVNRDKNKTLTTRKLSETREGDLF